MIEQTIASNNQNPGIKRSLNLALDFILFPYPVDPVRLQIPLKEINQAVTQSFTLPGRESYMDSEYVKIKVCHSWKLPAKMASCRYRGKEKKWHDQVVL